MFAVGEVKNIENHSNGSLISIFVKDCEIPYEKFKECEIKLSDGRLISPAQRRLLYALFRDIAIHTGHTIDEIKEFFKIEFMLDYKKDYFSLSDTDVENANQLIEYVLAFVFHHAIPLKKKVHILAKEVNNYLYLCLIYRACADCGNPADIHHADAIGMGRDRTQIDHTKHKLIALCRKHHQEAHTIGWLTFKQKYHLEAIKITKETAKKLGLKGEN